MRTLIELFLKSHDTEINCSAQNITTTATQSKMRSFLFEVISFFDKSAKLNFQLKVKY